MMYRVIEIEDGRKYLLFETEERETADAYVALQVWYKQNVNPDIPDAQIEVAA